jgi:hypothetical protein
MVRKDEHVGYEIKIFRDLQEYIDILKQLSAAESTPEDRAVMNMLFGISI